MEVEGTFMSPRTKVVTVTLTDGGMKLDSSSETVLGAQIDFWRYLID